MMQARVVLVLLAVICLQGAAAFTWEACDADATPFKATEVLLSPDPPVIGSQVTFTIKTNAGKRMLLCTIQA